MRKKYSTDILPWPAKKDNGQMPYVNKKLERILASIMEANTWVWSKGSPEHVFDKDSVDRGFLALDWSYFKSKYGCSRKWWSRVTAIKNIICDCGMFNDERYLALLVVRNKNYHDQGREKMVKLYN